MPVLERAEELIVQFFCYRGQNVSMVAALALKGLLILVQILGPTKGIQFETFIASVLVPILCKGTYVIMDDARIH